MIGLGSVGQRFETTLITEAGLRVQGTIQPVEDAKIYPDDYFYVRQILRVRPEMPVVPGDVVTIPTTGATFILGSLDAGLDGNYSIYTSFQMYPANKQTLWKREQKVIDPLTHLERSTGMMTLGNIWILTETLSREVVSQVHNVREETKRIVTGAAVEIGDVVDDMVVHKLRITHGVRVLEVK